MRLLLDTHAFLWWLAGDASLTAKARTAIGLAENEIYVSAASVWEITTKFRIGKLRHAEFVARDMEAAITDQMFLPLSVSVRHAGVAGSLTGAIRDPFDRMLIAQAMIEDMTLVSNEQPFDSYAVKRLW